ncbi:MAG: nucleoside monophosphate kinase [Patescibacteria group bacterium]|nr:nucleoside monophosphate kinase [Patescibacteria group bacterium]
MRTIILLGPPGSGKGTQAELLAERLGWYYLETSKVLEEIFNKAKKGEFVKVGGKKYFFSKEKNFWETGILNSPPFVSYVVKQKIKELQKKGKSLIMAGSPRTLYEGKEIIPLLEKLCGKKNIRVILIEVPAKESIFRNSHRRICQLMRHPILYSKETSRLKKCPLDGSKLIKRKGLDDPKTIKVRLKEYQKRTFPLIDYFKKEGLKVKKINGSPPPAVVFKDILKALTVNKISFGDKLRA